MTIKSSGTSYRWTILILAALTNMLVVAAPTMCLPVLFKEISTDLHLDLVQVGLVWGIGSLPGIAATLAGGAIGDRFGPRRILILACLLAGAAGALRGLANSFIALTLTVALFGLVSPLVTMNNIKTCGMWFSSRQLGVANGALSMGMAAGFLIGSLFSATLLSPGLGGWRNVLFLYGALGIGLALPWALTRPFPRLQQTSQNSGQVSIRQALKHVAGVRNIWLMGLVILGVSGCIQGSLGYLPLYLRGLGWESTAADGAQAVFHSVSLLCVIPITFLSDRIGSRKKVMIAALVAMATGIGLLSVADGFLVWVAVVIAGFVRDGFMGVFITSILEIKEIGIAYGGTATGLVLAFSGIGSLIAPVVGNSLAAYNPGLPFVFWAGLTLLGFVGLLLATEEKRAEEGPPQSVK